MYDDDLRSAVIAFQKQYGTTLTFIAIKSGVSREHLSRWVHDRSYVISVDLKAKIKRIVTKGEM